MVVYPFLSTLSTSSWTLFLCIQEEKCPNVPVHLFISTLFISSPPPLPLSFPHILITSAKNEEKTNGTKWITTCDDDDDYDQDYDIAFFPFLFSFSLSSYIPILDFSLSPSLNGKIITRRLKQCSLFPVPLFSSFFFSFPFYYFMYVQLCVFVAYIFSRIPWLFFSLFYFQNASIFKITIFKI